MSEERNESQEIYDCIKANGPITAENISQKTGWNRHLVDVAVGLMIEHGLIYQSGATPDEWKDPLYMVRDASISIKTNWSIDRQDKGSGLSLPLQMTRGICDSQPPQTDEEAIAYLKASIHVVRKVVIF